MSKLKFDREQIMKALNDKGTNLPCHRCGNKSFAIIDGFTRYHLSDNIDDNVLGGQGVPAILVACNKCGALTPHAALALVKPEEQNEKGENDGE